MLKTLVVDDHPLFRESLCAFLKEASIAIVIGKAGNGKEAIELTERLSPQLVIMDIRMSEMDGIAACRAIKERHPEIMVVLYTMYDLETYCNNGIIADRCLSKDSLYNELPGIIRGFSS